MIVEDLNMYYQSTWAFSKSHGDPVYVSRILAKDGTSYEKISTKYDRSFVRFADALREPNLFAELYVFNADGHSAMQTAPVNDLEFRWPSMGLFNKDWFAVCASRTSARTVTKGLSSKTMRFDIIGHGAMNDFNPIARQSLSFSRIGGATFDTFKIFRALYEPKYPSIEVALNCLVYGREFSVAVSKEIALSLHRNYNKLVVYYFSTPVATFDIKKKTWLLDRSLEKNKCRATIVNRLTQVLGGST